MKYNKSRKLGKYGEDVSPVGIGAMSFTNFYGPCNDSQAKHILNAALDMNLNHIDTSNVYGAGKSEEELVIFYQNKVIYPLVYLILLQKLQYIQIKKQEKEVLIMKVNI